MVAPPFMVVPSPTVFGGLPYTPVNVYSTPQTAGTTPVPASNLPQAEEELKQVYNFYLLVI